MWKPDSKTFAPRDYECYLVFHTFLAVAYMKNIFFGQIHIWQFCNNLRVSKLLNRLISLILSPWTLYVNWTHLRRSKDFLHVSWTSYVRSTYVLCLGGDKSNLDSFACWPSHNMKERNSHLFKTFIEINLYNVIQYQMSFLEKLLQRDNKTAPGFIRCWC